MDTISPRAAWFVGVDLGALVGLVVLATSTRSTLGPVLWPVTIVADWILLRRARGGKSHRTQFLRGTLQGYLVPVSIGLATLLVVGTYFLLTRGALVVPLSAFQNGRPVDQLCRPGPWHLQTERGITCVLTVS